MTHVSRLLIVVALGTVLLSTTPAGAASRGHMRVTRVHAFNADDQGIQPDGLTCSIAAGGCRGRVVGRTVWTGNFKGTATYFLNFAPRPDGALAYDGVETITGMIDGCGGGSFDLRITNGVYDPRKVVASGGAPVRDRDDWRIAPGSGTRDLVALSGHGSEMITEFNDGKTKSDLTGSVSCMRRPPSPNVTVSGGLHALMDAVPDSTVCDAQGGEFATSPTDYVYSGTSAYYGTFEGTGRFCGRSTGGIGPGNSVPFVEVDTFTGTVHGCATGTVTYTVHGFVEGRFDTANRGLPGDEVWKLVAGSGKHGLRRLRSGSGSDVGTINADSTIDAPFVGRVTCAASTK